MASTESQIADRMERSAELLTTYRVESESRFSRIESNLATITERLMECTNLIHERANADANQDVRLTKIETVLGIDSNTERPLPSRLTELETKVASQAGKWRWLAGVGGVVAAAMIGHAILQYL